MARQEEGQAAVLRQIHSLFQDGALGALTDGQLLERFMAGQKDSAQPAFTTLVERHGPMVWRVCRRVLTDSHQAEDAFQATFLVLVQQAGSVRHKDSVASWLYGVAYRVASCARSAESRRRKHEDRYAVRQERVARTSRCESAELALLLDEELNRLPDRFRTPIVLCDLEDVTHEQAAVRLGWPVGTVKSRLARGRERLRTRLVRRGLAPSLGLAGMVMLHEPAMAALPAFLIDLTVQSALGLEAGFSLTSSASAAITLWSKEVSKAMWMNKLRWGAIAVLTASTVGLGAGFLWRQAEARPQRPPARNAISAPPHWSRDDDATWARHVGNLKRIGLALHNYVSAEGHFPPAAITGKDGKPLLSWRVAILPYLVDYDGRPRDNLFKAFRLDEPWDGPHNKALLERMPAVFASSAGGSGQPFTTAYRGFVCPEGKEGTRAGAAAGMMEGMMEGGEKKKGVDATLEARKKAMGGMAAEMAGPGEDQSQPVVLALFRENRGVGVAEITDGTAYTLMVVEAAEAVPWTKPDDLPYSQNEPLPRLGGSMQGGFAALFAHGEVRFLDRRFDDRVLRCLITANGGEIVSSDQILGPGAPSPGGLIPQKGAEPAGESSVIESHRYAAAGTLENAVGILKDRLRREGKSEIADWLTESKARKAIRAGLQAYETYLRRVGEPELPRRQFEIVKPIYEQLATVGTWPAYSWFTTHFGVEMRDQITYDRHQVRLELEALDGDKPFHFRMITLDLFIGPVEEPSRPEALRDRQSERAPQ